jgi:hypothetical protein
MIPDEIEGVNIGFKIVAFEKLPLPAGLRLQDIKPVFIYPLTSASAIGYEFPAQTEASAPAYTEAAVFIATVKDFVVLFPQAFCATTLKV